MIRSLPNSAVTRNSTTFTYNVLVSLAILITLILVLGIWHIGNNPMIACGFFGAFFIHMGSRPSAAHFRLTLLAGAICALIYVLMSGEIGVHKFHTFMGFCAFIGSGSIIVMSLDRVWTGSPQYDTPLRDALILPVFSLIAGLSMQFTHSIPHKSFDYLLYRYDLSLGLTPGLTVYSWFQSQHWMDVVSVVTYDSLLCFPPLYHGWAMYKGLKPRFGLMQTFVIAGIIGFVLYQICPGIGPKETFGTDDPTRFPALSAAPTNVFMSTKVANAMPSMHMSWALLVWVAAWELGLAALVIATLFVTFTALATLGISAHYMIDLLVSFPLIMAAKGIGTARYRLTIVGLILCVGWETFLRTGIELPAAVSWSLIIGTIALTGWLMRPFFTLKAPSVPQEN